MAQFHLKDLPNVYFSAILDIFGNLQMGELESNCGGEIKFSTTFGLYGLTNIQTQKYTHTKIELTGMW